MATVSPCRIVTIHTFRGDRSRAFVRPYFRAMDDDRNRRGPGPSPLQCLLYAGHTGISLSDSTAIYAFNPDPGGASISTLMDGLAAGLAFPGVVRDDTAVFTAAKKHGLNVLSFQVLLPDQAFGEFAKRVDDERNGSPFTYGFPDGNGDCNCTTWLERIGLPLLTGRMKEFTGMPEITAHPSRRFGKCV
jgi:hypothetical protein